MITLLHEMITTPFHLIENIQGPLFLEFNGKIYWSDNLKNWGIYDLNNVMISRVLGILTRQVSITV